MGLFNSILKKIGAASGLRITEALNETRAQIEEAKKQAWRIRQPGTAYATGHNVIVPGPANFDKLLKAVTDGTTGAGDFPKEWAALTIGERVTDGSVVWEVIASAAGIDTALNGNSGNAVANRVIFDALNGKADAGHKHDGIYAPKGHNHDENYAPKGHNHDGAYSSKGHNHDGAYLKLSGGTVNGALYAPTPGVEDDSTRVATTAWAKDVFPVVEESYYLPYSGSASNRHGAYFYRKWSDGWMEQGGLLVPYDSDNTKTSVAITFLAPFKERPMAITRTNLVSVNFDPYTNLLGVSSCTATGFVINLVPPTYASTMWTAVGRWK